MKLVLAVIVAAGALAANALGAHRTTTVSYIVRSTGTEYVTSAGHTAVFPGRLETGDQILGRDDLIAGGVKIGFDNESCTVTFDGNDLCHVVTVLKGKGDVEGTWLWVGRNLSRFGSSFTGIVDGGTGAFANATGQFTGTVWPDGTLRITARLS
jgi:hypothetical protein